MKWDVTLDNASLSPNDDFWTVPKSQRQESKGMIMWIFLVAIVICNYTESQQLGR